MEICKVLLTSSVKCSERLDYSFINFLDRTNHTLFATPGLAGGLRHRLSYPIYGFIPVAATPDKRSWHGGDGGKAK